MRKVKSFIATISDGRFGEMNFTKFSQIFMFNNLVTLSFNTTSGDSALAESLEKFITEIHDLIMSVGSHTCSMLTIPARHKK